MYQIPPWAHPLSQVSQQSFLTKVVSDHFCAISDAKVFSRRLSETTFRQGSVAYITSFWPCPSLSLCLKPVWWWGCWGYISWLIGQSTSWTGGTEIRLTPFFLFFLKKSFFLWIYSLGELLGSWHFGVMGRSWSWDKVCLSGVCSLVILCLILMKQRELWSGGCCESCVLSFPGSCIAWKMWE